MGDSSNDSPAVSHATLQKLEAERIGKVRVFMDQLEIDLLVATSEGDMGNRGPVRYLANYATTSRSSCVLWARDALPQLIVPYVVFKSDAQAMSWIDDIQVNADFATAINQYIEAGNLTKGRVGWVGPQLHVKSVRAHLEDYAPGLDHISAQSAFSTMCSQKTATELSLIRRCAVIADRVMENVARMARPGITDREIIAEAEYVARLDGSEGGSMTIGIGSSIIAPVITDQKLEAGDVFQFSAEPIGPGGFWVQAVRTFVLGEPTRELEETAGKIGEAEEVAASLLRAGARTSEIASAMLGVMGQREDELPIQLGHGIGLVMAESPRFNNEANDQLHEDMTVVIHPGERNERLAVVQGNTYLVGKVRTENLSNFCSGPVIV